MLQALILFLVQKRCILSDHIIVFGTGLAVNEHCHISYQLFNHVLSDAASEQLNAMEDSYHNDEIKLTQLVP